MSARRVTALVVALAAALLALFPATTALTVDDCFAVDTDEGERTSARSESLIVYNMDKHTPEAFGRGILKNLDDERLALAIMEYLVYSRFYDKVTETIDPGVRFEMNFPKIDGAYYYVNTTTLGYVGYDDSLAMAIAEWNSRYCFTSIGDEP